MISRFAFLALATVLVSSARAQSVPPSELLHGNTIRTTSDELLKAARTAPDGIAFKVLLTRPDGSEQIAARVKSGQGEWHRDFADVLICLDGEAQIATGGKIVNGKETTPGEIRGDGVRGGKVERFGPGDVIRIEPQVPHQMMLAPGGTLRYFVVKVKTAK